MLCIRTQSQSLCLSPSCLLPGSAVLLQPPLLRNESPEQKALSWNIVSGWNSTTLCLVDERELICLPLPP